MEMDSLVRSNIRRLKPYSSARHEFDGHAEIYLDANENPHPSVVNRYPDPLQKVLKKQISTIKMVPAEQIFLGNGSDEAIDLLIRIFCEPTKDSILILPPTYGMYEVCADISNVLVKKVPLLEGFQPDLDTIFKEADANCKLLFLCNPNNPTGSTIEENTLMRLISEFPGIVVVDEAYQDFASQPSLVSQIHVYPKLVVMQTFSKAWGMAGVRLGLVFAQRATIDYLNAVKPPYNINTLTQNYVLEKLSNINQVQSRIQGIKEERHRMYSALSQLPCVHQVYPSEGNFLLVRFEQPKVIFEALKRKGIIVRDRSSVPLCEGCLRITIGTIKENDHLLATLEEIL